MKFLNNCLGKVETLNLVVKNLNATAGTSIGLYEKHLVKGTQTFLGSVEVEQQFANGLTLDGMQLYYPSVILSRIDKRIPGYYIDEAQAALTEFLRIVNLKELELQLDVSKNDEETFAK